MKLIVISGSAGKRDPLEGVSLVFLQDYDDDDGCYYYYVLH